MKAIDEFQSAGEAEQEEAAQLREQFRRAGGWSAGAKPHAARKGRLTPQIRLLLLVQGLSAAAHLLSGTFANVYLWKVKSDFSMIAWFAVYQQAATMLTFWLAGKWVKEHNKMNALRLGLGVSALFYALVLLLGTGSVRYVPLLGLVQGLAAGFFWLAFNVVYFEVTNPETRDRFNGWAGLIGSGAGMFCPWLAGFLITRLNETNGYRLVFSLSLAVFAVAGVCSFFLKKRKTQSGYDWLFGWKRTALRGSPWRRIIPALLAQGIREGVFAFVIGLLVYIATRNELKLGSFSLITSAVALVSFWLAGRLLKPSRRRWGMLLGIAGMSALVLPFFKSISYGTLLVFGIGTSLFTPLFVIPATSVVFDLIGREKDGEKRRVEYVVLREVALNAGRMIGTFLFIAVLAWSSAPAVLTAFLLVIGSAPVFTWFLLLPWLSGSVPEKSSLSEKRC